MKFIRCVIYTEKEIEETVELQQTKYDYTKRIITHSNTTGLIAVDKIIAIVPTSEHFYTKKTKMCESIGTKAEITTIDNKKYISCADHYDVIKALQGEVLI